jgi:hypothetical protein
MENLKRVGNAALLTLALCLCTSPCNAQAQTCVPGQLQTPPCASSLTVLNDVTALGEISTPPASDIADIASMAEIALGLLLIF